MTGLLKPKNYDWKDSNLALFGSDVEKLIKKESSQKEPAWRGAGTKVGLQIWRIVDFVVQNWKKSEYGKFYNGDSYIILNTYLASPNSDELAYDVHFWIGSRSTQDEYGTAAYKTVELDTYLDGRPVQHREVEGFESDLFRSYFPQGVTIMEGGAESGFNHVEPTKYESRLFHFSGSKKNIVVREVPKCPARIVSDDVFILDLGLTLYQWNGAGSNKDERFKAMQYLAKLKSERGKAVTETLEEHDTPQDHEFFYSLTAEDTVDTVALEFMKSKRHQNPIPQLFRLLSAGSGDILEYAKIKEGSIFRNDLDSSDVFLIDTGRECFVWLGKDTSPNEVQNGFGIAHSLLMKSPHPFIPISVIREGQENNSFRSALAA